MTATAPSSRPPPRPASGPIDLRPLRAKSLGKLRLESRLHARRVGADSLARAAAHRANHEIGEHLGGEARGAEARTGALVLTAAEVALLLPLDVGAQHLLDVLRERVIRELARPDLSRDEVQRLRLALTHLDALSVVLAA